MEEREGRGQAKHEKPNQTEIHLNQPLQPLHITANKKHGGKEEKEKEDTMEERGKNGERRGRGQTQTKNMRNLTTHKFIFENQPSH